LDIPITLSDAGPGLAVSMEVRVRAHQQPAIADSLILIPRTWRSTGCHGAVHCELREVSRRDSNVALDSRCESAVADIDVQLKHRHSLRPNLFKTVKAFTAHERGT
jgi:hypothetical protein